METPDRCLEEAVQLSGVPPEAIEEAANRIQSYIHETPIMTSQLLNTYLCSGTDFFFKTENFQKTGSFKIRGAMNAVGILNVGLDIPVVTHSSGNHGAALAAAARAHGRLVHVIIPNTAPKSKVTATESYGGHVVTCQNSYTDRVRVADATCAETGGILIHPFLNADVIAGQGTIGMEIMRQIPDLDAVVVPIGGGGLISGIAIAVKSIRRSVRIIGAEPAAACAAARSVQAGKRVAQEGAGSTVADGVRSGIGEVGWEVVRRLVDEVIVVDDEETVEAMRMVWTRLKVVIEASAGVGVAAAKKANFAQRQLRKVCIVLCGGNVALDELPWMVAST